LTSQKFFNSSLPFQSAEEWKTVFYISAGIYLIGCVIYWIWASGEVQPWAQEQPPAISNGDVEKNGKSFAYANEGIEMKDE
jgi:MFS transporter, ACS family, solute carrier family 17 (sodium-dependent inorganic phosphate cotransporter), other